MYFQCDGAIAKDLATARFQVNFQQRGFNNEGFSSGVSTARLFNSDSCNKTARDSIATVQQ